MTAEHIRTQGSAHVFKNMLDYEQVTFHPRELGGVHKVSQYGLLTFSFHPLSTGDLGASPRKAMKMKTELS